MTIINTVAGSSAKLAQKEVVPTSFLTVVEPPEGYDGLSKATVDAPENLAPENIKAGVSIAGVVGGYDNRLPEQEKTVKAVAFPTDVVPDDGKTLSKATVTTPDNLAAENIKKDVEIAGVTGTYDPKPNLEVVTLTPTVLPTTVVADAGYDGMKQVNVEKPETLVPENVKNGVNIAGVTGTYDGIDHITKILGELYNSRYTRLSGNEVYPIDIVIDEDVVNRVISYYAGDIGGARLPSYSRVRKIVIPDKCPQVPLLFSANRTGDGSLPLEIEFKGTVEPAGTGYSVMGSNIYTSYPTDKVLPITQSAWFDNSKVLSDTWEIPEGYTTLELYCNYKHYDADGKLTTLNMIYPSTTTKMSTQWIASSGYGSVSKYYKIRIKATTPPNLSGAVSNSENWPISITVPQGCLETYKTATNWSTYADIMVEASE